MINELNVYKSACGFELVTTEVDEGTTAFQIPCMNPECTSHQCWAMSQMYTVKPTKPPTHEWYREDNKKVCGMSDASQEHHANGGLFLRRIERSHAGEWRVGDCYHTRNGQMVTIESVGFNHMTCLSEEPGGIRKSNPYDKKGNSLTSPGLDLMERKNPQKP